MTSLSSRGPSDLSWRSVPGPYLTLEPTCTRTDLSRLIRYVFVLSFLLNLASLPSTCLPQVSTFSWWAAFLSDAIEIHYPLAGIFHPETKTPDFEAIPPGELTVYDEERYIYHDLVNRRWWGKFNICKDDFEYQYEF